MVAELILKGIGRMVARKNGCRNAALAMLKPKMLKKVANIWTEEEGWVYLL